jgi:glycosyltransferase involved in cell wall biosynthesis
MRILQVFNFFSLPHGGGTVAVIYQLSRALTQRGHEVTIYTSDFELDQDYISSLQGVTVYPFHCWLSLAGFYLMPGMIGETKRKLKNFDIIHLHCYRSFQNIVIHRYAKKYGIPYVLDAHGSTPRVGKRRLKWLFDVTFGYRTLRDASRVIAETEVGVNEYKELGVNQNKIVLITPPFATDEFSHLPPPDTFRRKYNIKEKHIILFLGRIHRIKGIDFLVESFYELTQDRDDVVLVIVGPDDGYKSSLEGLIDKLNLTDKVLFTGFLSGDDKLSALVDADMLVQTSRYEQGTGVPFEAVLCNTPIIVSKNTGSSENVSRIDAGYLVEFGNKKELKNTMQKILDVPTEAMVKTQKAKEYIITNLSMEKNVEKYEKVYIDCIKENKLIRGYKK